MSEKDKGKKDGRRLLASVPIHISVIGQREEQPKDEALIRSIEELPLVDSTQERITSIDTDGDLVDPRDEEKGYWLKIFTEGNAQPLMVESTMLSTFEDPIQAIGGLVHIDWRENEAGTRFGGITKVTPPEADSPAE